MNKPQPYPQAYLFQRIVQAKLFIDAHYAEPLEVDNIADEACFSKFHFIRLFRTMYGYTPHQYLVKVRVEKAKELLQKGMPVTDTCFEVGFESASSFTALFKRFEKISPSAYRQRFRERREKMISIPLHFVPNCFAEKKGWTE